MTIDDDRSDALRQIVQWAEAYPKEAFEPISDEELAKASEALARAGNSIGALHARWARILVEDLGRLAKEGLAADEGGRSIAERSNLS